MNCKQGDLAVIVKTNQLDMGWLGKIVTCKEQGPNFLGLETWICQETGGRTVADIALRPIRPSEGQDETLSWKDVPQGEIA